MALHLTIAVDSRLAIVLQRTDSESELVMPAAGLSHQKQHSIDHRRDAILQPLTWYFHSRLLNNLWRCIAYSFLFQPTLCTAAAATFAHSRSRYPASHQSTEGCATLGGSASSKCQRQPEHPHHGGGQTPATRCILSSPLLSHCGFVLIRGDFGPAPHCRVGACDIHSSRIQLVNAESSGVAVCRLCSSDAEH